MIQAYVGLLDEVDLMARLVGFVCICLMWGLCTRRPNEFLPRIPTDPGQPSLWCSLTLCTRLSKYTLGDRWIRPWHMEFCWPPAICIGWWPLSWRLAVRSGCELMIPSANWRISSTVRLLRIVEKRTCACWSATSGGLIQYV